MALRQTTQAHTTEAQLLVMPHRDDAKRFTAQTEEAVMDQSLSARSHSPNRKLRSLVILANALIWLGIVAAIRFFFF